MKTCIAILGMVWRKFGGIKKKRFLSAICVMLICAETNFGASFQGLGDLLGYGFESHAYGVSADGSVVVGYSTSSLGPEAFRWTYGEGMVGLGALGASGSFGRGVSGNGLIVVGESPSGPPGGQDYEAYRWTSGGGMVGLGGLAENRAPISHAYGASHDGSFVVGDDFSTSKWQAFRWSDGGMIALGDLPGGASESYARGVSGDGSIVVGWSSSASGTQAFRWTSGGGMVGLGDLAGGSFGSSAKSISSDGTVIVGTGTSGSGGEAFRWTSSGGMIGLGDLAGGSFHSSAWDVSADGSIVVGQSHGALGHEAFYWTASLGMRSIKNMLTNNYGLDLTGWSLTYASGVSADGLTIVGNGINPDGYEEAWIATIPEPATLLLLSLGAAFLRRTPKSI